jgi:hypothetical protein
LRNAVLGCFDWREKRYKHIPIDAGRVLIPTGNITLADDEAKLPHIVLNKVDGTAHGGLLSETACQADAGRAHHRSAGAPARIQRRVSPQCGRRATGNDRQKGRVLARQEGRHVELEVRRDLAPKAGAVVKLTSPAAVSIDQPESSTPSR